jgi:hypothetical protein
MEKLVELKKSGKRSKELSIEFNVSPNAVEKALQRYYRKYVFFNIRKQPVNIIENFNLLEEALDWAQKNNIKVFKDYHSNYRISGNFSTNNYVLLIINKKRREMGLPIFQKN